MSAGTRPRRRGRFDAAPLSCHRRPPRHATRRQRQIRPLGPGSTPASTPLAASTCTAAPLTPRPVTPPRTAMTLASGQVQRQGAESSHGGARSGGGTAGSETSRRAVAVARPSRAASSSSC
uniref:Uncharacterized protein n=1 Tax=Oryza sativa subsp. japonica TaxID=39947 RepID=Q6Z2I5_ORYSJ|nr:hypothetical protein [Oryza sativa Japonica Group]